MRKVIGIGETVLDIIFKNSKPDTAAPGGSTFNSMVSLGRAGVPAYFISEVGNNHPGTIILDFMKENGVSCEYVNVLPAKQPVSMAFLNEKNDAEYSFYRDAMDVHPDFKLPDIQTGDIVLFGSFFALNPVVREQVKAFLEYAKSAGAILYYDVNFRPAHKKDLGNILGSIEENYEYADVVRGSNQDFITLYGLDDPDKVYSEKILPLCQNFIYTKSAEPIEVRSLQVADAPGLVPALDENCAPAVFRKAYPVAPVAPVSTIGAGDSFNAGFIYALLRDGITKAPASTYAALAVHNATDASHAAPDAHHAAHNATDASHAAPDAPAAAIGHPETTPHCHTEPTSHCLSELDSESLLTITETQWDRLIATAQAFSANCCTSMYNYITLDFAKSLK